MKLHVRWLAFRVIGLILGCGLLAVAELSSGDGGKDQILPDAEYSKMLKRNVKAIQDALKNEEPEKAMIEKARTAAVMIACYAQQNLDGTDGQQRATVRDAALKVADQIKAKKYPEAAKAAAALPTLEADAKAKKEKVKLMDAYLVPSDVMHQYRLGPDGGYGIFGHLQRIQTKQYTVLPRDEINDAFVLEAYQIAVSADLLHTYPHKAKPKEWEEYTDIMRKTGVELAEALKAKDAKLAPQVISKLTTTCFNCHKMLKVKNTGN